MLKKEILCSLFEHEGWLCSQLKSGKMIQHIKVGKCENLYQQLNCKMTVGIHSNIEYYRTSNNYWYDDHNVFEDKNLRYKKIA